MLTRDQILAAGFRSEVVSTRIGDFRVRVMSGAVREQFEAAASDEQQRGRIRARWIRWTACDESGNLLFGEGDIDALAAMDSDIIIPVFEAALRINGLGSGAVEEAEKN